MSFFLLDFLLFSILLMLSIKDFREGIIPDTLLIIMAILALLKFGMAHMMSLVILGVLSYGLAKIYTFFRNQEWLGWGDVKMMTVSGLWLDPSQIPLFLMLGRDRDRLCSCVAYLKREQTFSFGASSCA